jgi:hypothetical protein
VNNESNLEVAAAVGDMPIHVLLGGDSRDASLSECWHAVHGAGQAGTLSELRHLR